MADSLRFTRPKAPSRFWRGKKPGAFALGRIIRRGRLAIFTRQLATLVRAGMPLVRALAVLARQEKNEAFKVVLEAIGETIQAGGNFSDAVRQHPKIFDSLFVNMVQAGEAGGMLEGALARLALFMEKAERIKGKVKAAMIYPIIIVLVAATIVSALMIFVIPKFEEIFTGLLKNQPLPGLTQAVLTTSRFIQHHALLSLGMGLGIWAAWAVFHRTPFGLRMSDGLLIRLPGVGDLFLKAMIARFARTFGTLLTSGVPILHALTIARNTAGNVWVAEALVHVHNRVKEGDNVARPLEATRIFPGMVTSMIEVGEETGALPEMLGRIADAYDEEVDNAVAGLTSIIEPVMIVFMALIVGTIVIALFLPIVKIIQLLS